VLGAGCWVLGAGCWVLGAGCWVQVGKNSLLVVTKYTKMAADRAFVQVGKNSLPAGASFLSHLYRGFCDPRFQASRRLRAASVVTLRTLLPVNRRSHAVERPTAATLPDVPGCPDPMAATLPRCTDILRYQGIRGTVFQEYCVDAGYRAFAMGDNIHYVNLSII